MTLALSLCVESPYNPVSLKWDSHSLVAELMEACHADATQARGMGVATLGEDGKALSISEGKRLNRTLSYTILRIIVIPVDD